MNVSSILHKIRYHFVIVDELSTLFLRGFNIQIARHSTYYGDERKHYSYKCQDILKSNICIHKHSL